MELLKQHEILFCFVIFVCKTIEISLGSVKGILLAKGKRRATVAIAFVEVLLWAFVISGVIANLSTNLGWLFSYCLGYTLGYYLGFIIEGKLAFGTLNVCFIVSLKDSDNVEKFLSDNNLGYYASECWGKSGNKHKFDTVLPRKFAKQIRLDIEHLCKEDVFVTNYDVTYTKGGYGVKKIRK